MTQQFELHDIQGIILHGYAELNDSYYLLLAIDDAPAAKRWLGELAGEVRNAEARPYEPVMNIAFTLDGLRKLGLDGHAIAQFAREFQEGMMTKHRRRALGDHGPSAPENWEWGAPDQEQVDLLLLLYAADVTALQTWREAHERRFGGAGVRQLRQLQGLTLNGRKEHFGFRDGIGQPDIDGWTNGVEVPNPIPVGEFVLGYPNAYGQYSDRPLIAANGPASALPQAEENRVLHDLGRNGSYMVFRQMAQDVHGFWSYLDQATRKADGTTDHAAMIALAAKMVGRWPTGAPLANAPDEDDPTLLNDDDFTYHDADVDGYKTPFGSHIRRTNPRDMLGPNPGSQESIAVGNRHRIIRRGRAYGPPLAESMDPVEILGKGDDGQDRGLHFICFNTNIGRQFDFLSQTWANNKRFAGLYKDADPIIGDHDPNDEGETGDFKVPRRPVRSRYTGLRRPVTVKGGAYFFMPGITAIRYLAALP